MFSRSINIGTAICVLCVALYASTAIAQDTIFTYQGELKTGGSLANGSFNMAFSLWNNVVGGTQVGSTITQNGVPVVDGRFDVELNFGAAAFDNNDRWLQLAVNGTTLMPRTAINRAPYAIQTRGIFVNNNRDVGIGTTVPEGPLHVMEGSAGTVTAQSSSSAVFERSGQNFVSILSPDISERGILFGDPENIANGGIVYNNASNPDGLQFRTGGNATGMSINADGKIFMGTPGAISFAKLRVDAGPSAFALDAGSNDMIFPTVFVENAGGGAALWALGNSDTSLAGGGLIVAGYESGANLSMDANEIMARNNGQVSTLFINANGGNVLVGSGSGGTAVLSAPILQITGGSDFSEMFDIHGEGEVVPGMVVVIDPENPGRLIASTTEYDRKVAGIVSGAGGVATGMKMGHDGTIADGEHPVALTGRVYCLVDASEEAIEPGDMLTTSSTPGHAMKVNDLDAAQGAIIGKAMTPMAKGETGLVLVLVNLQ